MGITENHVKIPIRGNPRWWTITNRRGTKEVVRVHIKEGCDYHASDMSDALPDGFDIPTQTIIFIILEQGQYKWPPLAAPALFMGKLGWDSIKEGGGKVVLYSSHMGQKLEDMLVGN